jgi:hypothetical protein
VVEFAAFCELDMPRASLEDQNPQRPLQLGDAAAHCRWLDVHVLGRRRETAEVRRANDHLQPPNLVHGKNPTIVGSNCTHINAPETAKLLAPLQRKEPYGRVAVTRDEKHGGDERHRLDVFRSSDAASALPVLLFVHGGGYVRGDNRAAGSPFYDNIMLWAVGHKMVGVNMTTAWHRPIRGRLPSKRSRRLSLGRTPTLRDLEEIPIGSS